MRPTNKIVCIVGGGQMGGMYADLLKTSLMQAVEICVIEPNEETAQKLKKFGYKVFTSLDNLPKNVVVTLFAICTPTHTHISLIRKIRESFPGAKIFCEKPLALTAREVDVLIESKICDDETVVCGMVEHFNEPFVRAKQWYEKHKSKSGTVTGELVRKTKMPKGKWVNEKEKSGGILLDLTIHDLDFISLLIGYEQLDVTVNIVTDAAVNLFVQYKDDLAVNVISSWDLPADHSYGIENSINLKINDNFFSYESINSKINYEGGRQKLVKERYPHAYTSELQASLQWNSNVNNHFPTLKQCRQVLQTINNINMIEEK